MRRGEEAEHLLSNPLFKQAFVILETDIIRAMKTVKPADKEAMEALGHELRALERHKRKLISWIQSGDEAKKSKKEKKV